MLDQSDDQCNTYTKLIYLSNGLFKSLLSNISQNAWHQQPQRTCLNIQLEFTIKQEHLKQGWEGSSVPNPLPWSTNKPVNAWFSEEFPWFRLLNRLMWWVRLGGPPLKQGMSYEWVMESVMTSRAACAQTRNNKKKSNTKGQREMKRRGFNGKK